MACPTCDHTIQNVAFFDSHSIYHCPRCGTMKDADPKRPLTVVPKLVERVIEFRGTLTDNDQRIIDNMERLGVTEAATHPEVRL